MKKIIVLLFVVLIVSCADTQEKSFLTANPLFYSTFSSVMIDFEVGTKIEEYRIDYKNIDEKIIDYGDGDSLFKYIFSFDKGRLVKTESINMLPEGDRTFFVREITYKGNVIIHSQGTPGEDLFTTEYRKEEYNDGYIYRCTSPQGPKSVYYISDNGLKVWRNNELFIENGKAKYNFEFAGNKIYYSFYNHIQDSMGQGAVYTNGILTEYIQYNSNYREVYTVTDGVGSILRYDLEGNLIGESELERRLGDRGFLIYQRVRHPDKRGYEYFAEMTY